MTNARIACLAPEPDQLPAMLQRIHEAGFDLRDVRIVRRPTARPQPAEHDDWTPPLALPPWLAWWSLPYAQASLWWQWKPAASSETARTTPPTVIPLLRNVNVRQGVPKR